MIRMIHHLGWAYNDAPLYLRLHECLLSSAYIDLEQDIIIAFLCQGPNTYKGKSYEYLAVVTWMPGPMVVARVTLLRY